MKFKIISIAILLLSPLMASAEIVVSNSGSIQSHTSSSASTGGNEVGEGGTVVTGNASASSKSEVKSGSDGTNVHIETSTEVNGQTETNVVDKTLKANEPVSVEVNSKAVSGKKPETSIHVNGEEEASSAVASVTEATITRTEPPHVNVFVSLTARVSVAIKSFFSAFKFW